MLYVLPIRTEYSNCCSIELPLWQELEAIFRYTQMFVNHYWYNFYAQILLLLFLIQD